MKKLYALPLALIFALPAQAGVWDLFPLGNATYYADSAQQPVSVELYRMDSVLPGAGEDVLYFNKRSRSEMLGPCAATLQDPFSYLYGNLAQDSLIQRNDTILYNSEYSSLPFYFLPMASVGQSWTVTSDYSGNSYNQITITCTSIEQRTFLGIADSVKVFSLMPSGSYPGQASISDFQIVLSKAHGLVEFVPFDQFLYHPNYIDFGVIKMVGVSDGVNSVGFDKPEFADYFHLHAGDVLYWEIHDRPADISYPETYAYRKDSITSSTITPDSVIYYGDVTHFQPDGTIGHFSGLIGRYYRSNFEVLLSAGTNALAFMQNEEGPNEMPFGFFPNAILYAGPYHFSMADNGLDTITELGFSWGGHYWDTTYCEVGQMTDTDNAYKIDTRAGCTWISFGFLQPFEIHTTTLIGSVINGVEDGDITLSVNTLNSINGQAFTLMPNPAKESITFLGLPPGATGQYTIYDGIGRQALHGALTSSALSVEGLQPGVYVVQVRLSDRTERGRFVKE